MPKPKEPQQWLMSTKRAKPFLPIINNLATIENHFFTEKKLISIVSRTDPNFAPNYYLDTKFGL